MKFYYPRAQTTSAEYYNVIHLSQASGMHEKQARLTILIDPKSKMAFEKICSRQDTTSSHMVRTLILEYLHSHDAGPASKAKKTAKAGRPAK